MSDEFKDFTSGLESPATRLSNVTPDDGADIAVASRALNVSGAGTVRVTTVSGDTGTVYIAAGITFPIRARRIWATGTTASGIIALS